MKAKNSKEARILSGRQSATLDCIHAKSTTILILVLKTSENPFWVRDLAADWRLRWFAQNAGRHVVSFSPHLSRSDLDRAAWR